MLLGAELADREDGREAEEGSDDELLDHDVSPKRIEVICHYRDCFFREEKEEYNAVFQLQGLTCVVTVGSHATEI